MTSSIDKLESGYGSVSRPDSLPYRVKTQILDMVRAGQLKPGDRLLPERDLAVEMGVSRNVVREALRSLVDANVLVSRQGLGVFVASLDINSLIEPLDAVLSLENVALRSLAKARLVIEPGIAALAATNVTDADLDGLKALLDESHAVAEDDAGRFLEADIALHAEILRIADNPFLTRIMLSLSRLARTSREITNSVPLMRHTSVADHERIVAALRTRDPHGAREAMQTHLENVAQNFTSEDGRDD